MTTTIDVLTIGGIDFRSYTDIQSVELQEGLPTNSDSLNFDVVLDYTTFVSGSVPRPLSGQKVTFSLSNGESFSGVVTTVDQSPRTNLDVYTFRVSVTESTRLLDKHLVVEKGPNNGFTSNQDLGSAYAGEIVRELVEKYAPGFDLSQIDNGYVIPRNTHEYESLSSVIDSIAQSIGYLWYVDDYAITFTLDHATDAPISQIFVDSDRTIGGVSISEDTSRLYNRLFLKDFTAKEGGTRTDSFIADANQSFFGVFQEMWSVDDVNVTVTPPDGSPQQYDVHLDPLTTRDGDLSGSEGECFVCILNSGIRFPEDHPLEPGSNVDVNYAPVAGDQVITLEDTDSMRMMMSRESGGRGPTDGVYERVLSLPEFRVESVETISAYGMLLLDRIAWPVITGQFQTISVEGWKPGQTFVISSPKRDLYDHKEYWKTGRKVDPRVYVQTVARRYVPTREGIITEMTTVNFSSLANELII